MKFNEVMTKLELFGVGREMAASALNSAKDSAQAKVVFESIKLLVHRDWIRMLSGEVSRQRVEELRPTYEAIMRIELLSYKPQPKPGATRQDQIEAILSMLGVK